MALLNNICVETSWENSGILISFKIRFSFEEAISFCLCLWSRWEMVSNLILLGEIFFGFDLPDCLSGFLVELEFLKGLRWPFLSNHGNSIKICGEFCFRKSLLRNFMGFNGHFWGNNDSCKWRFFKFYKKIISEGKFSDIHKILAFYKRSVEV